MTQRALTSKPFWAYEIITTVLLSLNVVLWIGRSPLAILLIVLTFAITNSIAWIVCKDRIGIRCFLSWLFGGAAYILDIALIDIFRMSTHESYPLIMESVLLAPLFAAISGVICLSIWIVTANIYKSISFKRTVAAILSCISAIGAGICIGAGLYWWFAAIGLIAILSGWWFQKLLRSVPNTGILWAYQSIDKFIWYQNWKPKTNPVNGTDYLSQLKIFLPFIQITLFVFFAAVVGSGFSRRVNKEPQWKAEGLRGQLCALQFTDELSAIALSTYSDMYEHTDTAFVYESVDGGKDWNPLLIFPNSTFFVNDFITAGNDLYSVVRQDSIYRIISVNMKSHKHHISTFEFDRYPIMFDNDGSVGILSNNKILRSDFMLNHIDSIGEYSVPPAKYGYANFDDNIYGFIFDQQKSKYQLYDYSNGRIADSTSYSSNPHFLKLNSTDALIVGRVNDELTALKYNIKKQSKQTICRLGNMYVKGTIHTLDNYVYFLSSKGANSPQYINLIRTDGETWYSDSACDSHINAYCVTDAYLYYYDHFMHEFHRRKLQSLN